VWEATADFRLRSILYARGPPSVSVPALTVPRAKAAMSDENTAGRATNMRERGLALFGACGALCAVTSSFTYRWTTNFDTSDSRFLIATVFCGLPYASACIGFIWLVSGVPCYRLPGIWSALRAWQRVVLVTFVFLAAWVVIICVAYLLDLTTTPPSNSPL
jgi:hypothetical protein